MKNLKMPVITLVIVVIALVAIAGGMYVYKNNKIVPQNSPDVVRTESDKYLIYSNNLTDPDQVKSQIFSYNFKTGKTNQISSSTVTSALYPEYSPGASLVAYFSTSDPIHYCNESCDSVPVPKYKLIVQNIITGVISATEEDADIDTPIVALSPDGKKLAYYTTDKKIAILDIANKDKKSFATSIYYRDINWGQDNMSIYYLNKDRGQIVKLNTTDGSSEVVYANKEKFEIRQRYLTQDGFTFAFILNDAVPPKNLYTNYGNEYLILLNLATGITEKHLLESNSNRSAEFLATNGVNEVGNFIITSDNNTVYFEATDEAMYIPGRNQGVLLGIKSFNIKTGETKILKKESGGLLGFGSNENELVLNGPYLNSGQQRGLYSFNLTDNALNSMNFSKDTAPFQITYPIGGEIFKVGQHVNITWKSNVNYPTVKIQVVAGTLDNCSAYTNNGSMATCRGYEIYSGENTGSFNWTVPAEYPSSGNFLIRIWPDIGRETVQDLNTQGYKIDGYSGYITLTQ